MPDTLRIVNDKLLIVDGALSIWDGTGDPCCCDECSHCSGDISALQIQLDLSGVINGIGGLGCSALDGSYVLDYAAGCSFTFDGALWDWQATFGFDGTDYFFTATISGIGGSNATFKKVFGGSRPACNALSGTAIPFLSGSGLVCDFSVATLLGTAV